VNHFICALWYVLTFHFSSMVLHSFLSPELSMDDNHRLMEWMAYHYHVLPLRYMIVVVDPRSKTSPSSIFNEWRRKGVYIEEWTDRDFW
jgi:hypothetical protein